MHVHAFDLWITWHIHLLMTFKTKKGILDQAQEITAILFLKFLDLFSMLHLRIKYYYIPTL